MLSGKEVIVYKNIEQYRQDNNCHILKGIEHNQCNRCQSVKMTPFYCEYCGQRCLYCRYCMNLGMVTNCCYLVHFSQHMLSKKDVTFCFDSQLSPKQKEASNFIKNCVANEKNVLLTAVTGAGKTEMIFESIKYKLEHGGRVCIASPRIDVCLELAPRIQAVFPNEDIIVLYGDMIEKYRYTHLLIATTHQLLKFKKAFDLLIIDESDSFPFENNQMLQKRVAVTLREHASLIYLTATPNKNQLKLVEQGDFEQFELSARYHQYALPVPAFEYIGNWQYQIQKKCLRKIVNILQRFLKKSRRFLLFMPHIAQMESLEHLLHECLPQFHFTSVSAQDDERIQKVEKMRQNHYHFLLTTTILERGVTFSNIDVIVLGSDDFVFNQASLVQIAGRVGRRADYPTGEVLFLHNGITKEMVKARRFIREMNKKSYAEHLIKG